MDEVEFRDRQIWLRAFYGFDPENTGFIGFTEEWQRADMMAKMRDGDLVLIYGAVENQTQLDLRRQALGFLEVTLETCSDRARMSVDAIRWKVEHHFEDRWRFGLKVRRAWRITNRVHIKTIAPNSYHSDYRFERTTRAKLMEPEDRRRALTHKVQQVNVFGEAPIKAAALATGTLDQVLSPSRAYHQSLVSDRVNWSMETTFSIS